MAITPTGLPAWVRSNNHTHYGGHLNKTNYQSQDAVNPRTDVTAQNLCRMAADLEAVQRTADLASLTFQCVDGGSPAAPTILDSDSMWDALPTPTRNGNGDVTFQWANSYTDPYGQSGAVTIAHAIPTLHGATAGQCTVELVDARTVRVRAFDAAGAALSNAKVSLEIS